MELLDLQNLLPEVAIAVIFAWVIIKTNRGEREDRRASEKRYEALIRGEQEKYGGLIRAEQETREKQTQAIVSMYKTIDQWNSLNSINQRDCASIRESLSIEVTRLREAQDNKG